MAPKPSVLPSIHRGPGCKLVVGLGLAFWLVNRARDPDVAAAGAITGVTVGTVVALAYMVLDFLLSRGREDIRGTDRPDSAGSILVNILKIAVPITLSSSMVGIVTVIDSSWCRASCKAPWT